MTSNTSLTPSTARVSDARFFIDHGMIHDRKTGKHVTTDDDTTTMPDGTVLSNAHASGVTDTCRLLNELADLQGRLDKAEREGAYCVTPHGGSATSTANAQCVRSCSDPILNSFAR